MLTIGIIGAGTILNAQIEHYINNKDCRVKAVADLNTELAKSKAEKYGIENYYSDYQSILSDNEIDAVCILTPTFTHKTIVLEALKSKKHVFCEKPPALNADEARECVLEAEKQGKLLMYGFVVRFESRIQFMKEYIDSGRMGNVICAEAMRMSYMVKTLGWFSRQELGGGIMMDEAIHQLDATLHFMNYPPVKSVTAFRSDVNRDLPEKVKYRQNSYLPASNQESNSNIEDFIKAFILFENGKSLYIKTSRIMHTFDRGISIEVNGENACLKLDMSTPESSKSVSIMETCEDGYQYIKTPLINKNNPYEEETKHFVNCCLGKEELRVNPNDGVHLMEIIDAIYESARTGKTVLF